MILYIYIYIYLHAIKLEKFLNTLTYSIIREL